MTGTEPAIGNLGPLFVPPEEPDRFWIVIVLFVLPVIGAALLALVRGRLPDSIGDFVFVLPLVCYLLGDMHLMEESKKVEFCGSCHTTMSPLVEAMRTDGEHLSGIHYRRGAVSHESACYRCHSGYGIWGGVSAKSAGFRHMMHTVMNSYEYPLKLASPLDIDSCRDCHAGAAPFREAEPHRDPAIQEALLSGELGCTGACHPSAHPEDALRGVSAWGQR